jgi:hypothetical protein
MFLWCNVCRRALARSATPESAHRFPANSTARSGIEKSWLLTAGG